MRAIAIGAGIGSRQQNETKITTQPNCVQTLKQGTVQSLENNRPVHVKIERGRLWLTVAGDSNDYTLRSGQSLTISQRGKIVVQAIEDSCFQVSSCA